MTSPINESAAQPRAESFVDWFHINSRMVTAGAVVVAAAAFGYWIVQRTAYNETISADRQLLVAKQSLNSGNEALAAADLKKVADKYPSKPAGGEAGMLLAQLQLGKGDVTGAITGLRALASKVTSGPTAASIRGLLGDALVQAAKPAEAAAEYVGAAKSTSMANERAYWEAKAGRAYLAANNTVEARKLYEALAAQTENEGIATEARVRLGELSVGNRP